MKNNCFALYDRIIVPELGKFSFFSLKGEFLNAINTGRMIAPIAFLDANHFLHSGGLIPPEKSHPIYCVFSTLKP